jgi:hypothetical protein
MSVTSVVFIKLPKVNNHLISENSPILVTLDPTKSWGRPKRNLTCSVDFVNSKLNSAFGSLKINQ